MSELVNVSIDETTELVTVTITEDAVSAGDMRAEVYDPQAIAADAFDRANHTGTQLLASISDAGTAAALDVGTGADNIVQLDEFAKLPPVDGSQLINLPGSSAAVDSVNGFVGHVILDADDIDDTSTVNKFTTAVDIAKLAGIEAGADVSPVVSVNAQTGAVVLDADDISDASTAKKFTTASDILKLSGIQAGAEVNINADWSAVSGDALILNKPTLGTAAAADTVDFATAAQGSLADTAVQPAAIADFETTTQLNARDAANRNRTNHTGTQPLSTISDAGTAAALNVGTSANQIVQLDGSAKLPAVDGSQLLNLPGGGGAVDSVNGFTGIVVLDADDISDAATTNKFTTASDILKLSGIQAGAEVNINADWSAVSGDAQILNKPTLGTAAAASTTDFATAAQGALADSALQPDDIGVTVQAFGNYATNTDLTNGLNGKQNTLVSGTNIKTVNGNSLIGSGDLTISGGGGITLDQNGFSFVSLTGQELTLHEVAANEATINTTGFKVITSSNLQTGLGQIDSALEKARATGVNTGGALTVVGGVGVGTTFSLTAGNGQIYDESAGVGGEVYYSVSWSAGTGLATAGNGLNWVYIDNTGAINVTLTAPTESTYRTRLYLWRLSVTSGVITGINPDIVLTKQLAVRFSALAKVVGIHRELPTELLIAANGTNLRWRITAGSLYAPASNYPDVMDVDSVAYGEFNTSTGSVFQYRLPNNTNPLGANVNATDISVGYYAPGGVWTLIPGATSRVGIHYVWRFPGSIGNVRVTPGDAFYSSVDNAKAALDDLKAYTSAPSSFTGAFLLGAILVTPATTNLNTATFVQTNQAGSFSGGSVASVGGATTLQAVYNNATPDPEIVTNTTNGALTIRNGREFDADTALTIQNTAGTQTFYVTGDGSVGMNHLSVFLTAIQGSVTGNAGSVTNGVYTNGSYANPDWITSLAWGKITGAPNFTTTSNNLGDFNVTTSTQLRGVISDETGTGALVFATSPTLVTPNLGTPSAIALTNGTGLPQSGVTNLTSDLALKAPLFSPAFTGTPTAPTAAEGTNSTAIATTAFVANTIAKQPEVLIVAVGSETTALTTGTAKVTFRMPFAMTLTGVRASVTTAPTGGTLLTVDINENGVSVISTKLTFDASEKTTVTAATPPVISDPSLADDAEMTIDIDAVGSTIAGAGLKVTLIGTRT